LPSNPTPDPYTATVVHADTTCPALLNLQLDHSVGGDLPDDPSHLHGPGDLPSK
jgi:hypothetical protein